ncbi:uncharacterized protein LOC110185298 [Drosophila serrata]|uniref:uncharacterized protein LOC110185298 n=1 Tax=Drosophila serrata TaxID=7274 RepID=UPI000A1D10F7|nr:uncharacterized protein LOC110185298 [Drosophila serrata]XP_020809708.1 uncharacterized protein LOC110185298 [Drosophila serrata]
MNTRKKTKSINPPQDIYTVNANICRLVSQNPCLYDRLNDNYSKTTVLQNVWKEIGKEMKIPAKTCQQRWRNMRTSYARSIKEHPEGTKYYMNKELEFLKKYITPGFPIPPRGRRSRGSRREEQDDESDEDQKPILGANSEVRHAQRRNRNETEDASTFSEEGSGMARRLSKRSKENLQPSCSNRNAEHCLDFDDAFLQGLRPEINQMNFTQKLFFKRRVYDLLGEIFATEMPTPNSRQEVVNEVVQTPSLLTPIKRFGLQLQLPKLTPKIQKHS